MISTLVPSGVPGAPPRALTPSDRMRAAAIAAFENGPAYMADGQAFRRGFDSHCVRPTDPDLDQLVVAERLGPLLGCHLALPLAIRTYADGTGARVAQIVLHTFISPVEAEIAVLCRDFSWTRPALIDAILWAGGDLGLRRLVARIRLSDWRTQDLARRAGFKFEAWTKHHFADGEDASVWVLDLDLPNLAELIFRLFPNAEKSGPADAQRLSATSIH